MSNKALVVGGSNGIGLALTKKLVKQGYHVIVVDREQPSEAFEEKQLTFIKSDLSRIDYDMFLELSKDDEISILFVTAGFGRVTDFENLHAVEIQKLINVNTISAISIIRAFYSRIKNENDFYCGVMGSIAGIVSSPMFSVYSASKAAICKFIEAINIELECSGVKNRILNVSPGSIKGTRFNGGENDLSLLADLADNILKRLFDREGLFIPNLEVYEGVLEKYNKDPHKFGLESYTYKKESGRVSKKNNIKIGYLSGTFDLFHVGHLNLIRRAKEQCDYLIVGVHLDASHKGKETFIPFEERIEIVGSCRYVDKAVVSCKEDSDAWNLHKFDKLFVGSDYKGSERFKKYEQFFADKEVEIVYFPYTSGTSSSQIRSLIKKEKQD